MRMIYWLGIALATVAPTTFAYANASFAGRATQVAAMQGAGAPLHVPDMAYYQGLHQNERVDPAWFARHFTMTQQGSDDSYAVRFLAGGTYAMQYADPAFVPYCTWPEPYACKGPIGVDVHDETGWLIRPTENGCMSSRWSQKGRGMARGTEPAVARRPRRIRGIHAPISG